MGREKLTLAAISLIMLSLASLKLGHLDYYLRLTTGAEDYYTGRGAEPDGVFLDTAGAKLLGLSGPVSRESLTLLFRGYSPTGQRLVQNADKKNHCGATDICLSGGKDYSLLIPFLSPDERPIGLQCLHNAIQETIQYIEQTACFSRRGQGGNKWVPANVVAAYFEHCTSRAMDPHWHGHILLFTACVRADGTSGALHTKPFFNGDFKKAYGAFFRHALKNQLRQHLGIDAQCRGCHLVIPGFSEEARRHFSKRSFDIKDYMQKRGLTGGTAAAYATLGTRQDKGSDPPHSQLFQFWTKEAEPFGLTPKSIKKLLHQVTPEKNLPEIPSLIDTAIDNVLKNKTCFNKDMLYAEAFKTCSQCDISPKKITAAVDHKLRHSTRLIKLDKSKSKPRYTTQQARSRNNVLAKEVENILSKPAPSLKQRKAQPVFDQYQKPVEQACDIRLQKPLESMMTSKLKQISSKTINAVINRHRKKRSALVEEARHHIRQLRRQFMKQKTIKIDRSENKRYAKQTVDESQSKEIHDLTSDRSRIAVLRKGQYDSDFVLRVSREAWEKAGYTVVGTSLSKARVGHMEKTLGVESMTLRTLFLKMNPTVKFRLSHHKRQLMRAAKHWKTYGLEKLRINKKCVLIVDNADSLSMEQMRLLIHQVDRQGGKLVLVQGQSNTRMMNSAFHAVATQLEQRETQPQQQPQRTPTPESSPQPLRAQNTHQISKEISR